MISMNGMRILICGKGGSGKSSLTTLMARALVDREYRVLLLDGDASNPGGLARLAMGLEEGPKPLIDFFGGRKLVECPVDDPSPLTRKGDLIPLTQKHLQMYEIPPEYYVVKDRITLLQVGKIKTPLEGCDGPMSKVTRDFIVDGDAVTLIDVEAGIEHFGRGIEKNVDMVIIATDPTFESFVIAERVCGLCQLMGIRHFGAILNNVQSAEMLEIMTMELNERGVPILGVVHHNYVVMRAALEGSPLGECQAFDEICTIIARMEHELTLDAGLLASHSQ